MRNSTFPRAEYCRRAWAVEVKSTGCATGRKSGGKAGAEIALVGSTPVMYTGAGFDDQA